MSKYNYCEVCGHVGARSSCAVCHGRIHARCGRREQGRLVCGYCTVRHVKRSVSMPKANVKKQPKPVIDWCSCIQWRSYHKGLDNYRKMNFCIFCGKKLNKGG